MNKKLKLRVLEDGKGQVQIVGLSEKVAGILLQYGGVGWGGVRCGGVWWCGVWWCEAGFGFGNIE